MKVRFLSFLMGAVIALSVFTLPVKKSEAAVAIIAAAASSDGYYNDYYYYGGGGCIFISTGYYAYPSDAALVLALIFIVLDEKGQMDQAGVAQGLSNKFPFIDNAQVMKSLVSKITSEQAAGKTLISLPEAEVRETLLPAALSESEISDVVNYLK